MAANFELSVHLLIIAWVVAGGEGTRINANEKKI
jgi:hypothetical protein